MFVDDQIILLRSSQGRRSGGNIHHLHRRSGFEKNRESGFYTLQPDSDLDGIDVRLDVPEAQEKILEKPLAPILRALDIEPVAALRGENQTQEELGSFI
jgi:hypothetical protein